MCSCHKFQTANLKYFMVINIRWGFNNIWIKEGDKWKAAFITNRGLYEPTVMSFGLCNTPPSFQRMMDIHFCEHLNSSCVFIYIDDLIILGDTLEELDYWTHRGSLMMRKTGLSCKHVKCQFKKEMVKYVGMIPPLVKLQSLLPRPNRSQTGLSQPKYKMFNHSLVL